MSVWGIRALESDKGLDAIDCLSASYLRDRQQINLEEMAQLLMSQGLLGRDEQSSSLSSDTTALVLAELLYEWHVYGSPEYDCDCAGVIWQSITAFSAAPESVDKLLHHVEDIYADVCARNDSRPLVRYWLHSACCSAWVEHLENLIQMLTDLRDEALRQNALQALHCSQQLNSGACRAP